MYSVFPSPDSTGLYTAHSWELQRERAQARRCDCSSIIEIQGRKLLFSLVSENFGTVWLVPQQHNLELTRT